MFWKKSKLIEQLRQPNLPYPYRTCTIYISEKFSQIIFVPLGKITLGHAELENILTDSWPCDFGRLQSNIEETLNKYQEKAEYKGIWYSYDNSKSKTQTSFETDYIHFNLETDLSRTYGEKERERIKVTARPTKLDNTYFLTGTSHLLDTKIAQIVCDIFDACVKIRS